MTDLAIPLFLLTGVVIVLFALSRYRSSTLGHLKIYSSHEHALDSKAGKTSMCSPQEISKLTEETCTALNATSVEPDIAGDAEEEEEEEEEELALDETETELIEFLDELEEDNILGPICTDEEAESSLSASGLFQLVCTKKAEWIFGLSETNQTTTNSITTATQNNVALKKSSVGWELQDLESKVLAETSTNKSVSIDLKIDKQSPTIFRLLANTFAGKQVQVVRDGNYLVLTPPAWSRCVEISGPAAIEQELVLGATMTAHYFSVENSEPPIAFDLPDKRRLLISGQSELFQLSGHAIPDETEQLGVLFGKSLPKVLFSSTTPIERDSHLELLSIDSRANRTLRKWTINSKAAIELSKEFEDPSSGCYRIELRNSQHAIIQSKQFRFCSGLESIFASNQNDISSDLQEQANAILEVSHLPSAKIQLAAEQQSRYQLKATETSTIICDKAAIPSTIVKLTYSDGSCATPIPITTVCNKLWWRLIDSSAQIQPQQPEWTDRPISIPATLLKSASKAELEIKFPTTRWASKVTAKLSKKSKHTYKPLVNEEVLSLRLRDFCDSRELEIPGAYPLIIECERSAKRTEYAAGTVEVFCTCKFCDAVESKSTIEALNHIVESHRTELFSPVSQQRRKQLELEAPDGIYHCDYCDLELVFKHYSDVAPAVKRHIAFSCNAAPKENPKTPRLIQSKEDIVANLGLTQVCSLCKEEFEGNALHEMAEHYATTHKSKTLKLMS
ncbi:MAG: hypothetical protein WCT03_02370 [Candidatus Obscuribacterales bacterium]|jgi:hypothetical protein